MHLVIEGQGFAGDEFSVCRTSHRHGDGHEHSHLERVAEGPKGPSVLLTLPAGVVERNLGQVNFPLGTGPVSFLLPPVTLIHLLAPPSLLLFPLDLRQFPRIGQFKARDSAVPG